MAINETSVLKVAHLAKLALSPAELTQYVGELSNILQLVEQMEAVDTTNIEPMTHPLDATLRLREDAITATDKREVLQSLAPDAENGLYKGPKVID